MLTYLAKRLMWMVPTFLGITALTFAIAHLAPGDPLGGSFENAAVAAPESLEEFRRQQGLDRPLPLQYLRWLGKVVRMDFGRSSHDHRLVLERLGEALPRTALLSGLALLLALALAVPLGVTLAVREHRWWARFAVSGLFILYSLPMFFAAVGLLLWLSARWHWLPMQGLTSPHYDSMSPLQKLGDVAWHLVLPVICLSYGALASVSQYLRAAMVEALRQPFVLSARAQGLSERAVLYKHALRYAMLPVVALVGGMLPGVVSGSVIVERIFGIAGMGQLAFEAVLQRDYPTVMGVTTLVAALTMLSMLVADVVYAWVDPRIRLKERA